MIRIINIIGRRGMYDLPSFLITANEPLTIKFTGLDARLGKYVATMRRGTEERTMYLSDIMSFDVPADWLLETNVEKPIEVFLELRDNTGTRILIPSAKSPSDTAGYYIEPLKLEKVNKAWSMVAWLQRIEREITALKKRINEETETLSKRIQRTEDKLSEYEEKGVPLSFED